MALYSITDGGMVVLWVALLTRGASVPDLILSSDYCLCRDSQRVLLMSVTLTRIKGLLKVGE